MLLCGLQPVPDQVDLRLWRFDASLGFLLKGMQNVNSCLELDRIYGPISIPIVSRDNFNNTRTNPVRGLASRCFKPI